MQWGVGGGTGYEAKDLPSTVMQRGVGGGTGYEAKDLPSTVMQWRVGGGTGYEAKTSLQPSCNGGLEGEYEAKTRAELIVQIILFKFFIQTFGPYYS